MKDWKKEKRKIIHPFDDIKIIRGKLGYKFYNSLYFRLDVFIPIGSEGLI